MPCLSYVSCHVMRCGVTFDVSGLQQFLPALLGPSLLRSFPGCFVCLTTWNNMILNSRMMASLMTNLTSANTHNSHIIWFEHATKHQTCKPHSTKIRPGRVLTNVRTLPRQVPTTQGTDDILHYLAVLLSASRCVSFQKTSRLCQQHLWWECHSLSPEAPEICDI
jgi:hypothetical protein